MSTRAYGQYCSFARALELVGERWALLIVRDLLVGPKRFTELQRGLPKIPSNILTVRLKELEESGLVRRRVQPRPSSGVAYELTNDGRDLEEFVLALSRWGARHMGEPQAGEVITDDSIATALRTIFRAECAPGDDFAFEVRVGPAVVNAQVREGAVVVARGAVADPDLIVEAGPEIRALLAREISASDAIRSGAIRVHGRRALLDRFVQLFRV